MGRKKEKDIKVELYIKCSMIGTDGDKERKEIFYLTTHSTHFIYGYMATNIW